MDEQIIEEKKQSKEELKRERLEIVRGKEDKVFNALKSFTNYKELVSDCYTDMDAHGEMVYLGISTGAIIEGAGGTGKTYRIINKGIKLKKEFAYTDSFSTPQAFYCWLYKHGSDECGDADCLIVDDCAGILNNDKCLAFLKGALWEVNGERMVTYMTTKELTDEDGEPVPRRFNMKARIIIITNYLNKKNPHVEAVLSRVLYSFVDVPRKELLSILDQIAEKDYENLSWHERIEVLNFLKEKTTESTKNLNIRTLLKMFQFKIYSKQCGHNSLWQNLSLSTLNKDNRLSLVETILTDENFESEQERIEKFAELTGESKATFYRLKKQLGIQKNRVNNQKEVSDI